MKLMLHSAAVECDQCGGKVARIRLGDAVELVELDYERSRAGILLKLHRCNADGRESPAVALRRVPSKRQI